MERFEDRQPPQRAQSSDDCARVERLDHVGIVVADADKAAEYYRDALGIPVLHDERLSPVGVRLVYLDMGEPMLQLVEPIGPGNVRDHFEAHGEGLHHLCFAVHDIPRLLAVLPGEGGNKVFQGGRERLACFLRATPNGVLIEVTELTRRSLAYLDHEFGEIADL